MRVTSRISCVWHIVFSYATIAGAAASSELELVGRTRFIPTPGEGIRVIAIPQVVVRFSMKNDS